MARVQIKTTASLWEGSQVLPRVNHGGHGLSQLGYGNHRRPDLFLRRIAQVSQFLVKGLGIEWRLVVFPEDEQSNLRACQWSACPLFGTYLPP